MTRAGLSGQQARTKSTAPWCLETMYRLPDGQVGSLASEPPADSGELCSAKQWLVGGGRLLVTATKWCYGFAILITLGSERRPANIGAAQCHQMP